MAIKYYLVCDYREKMGDCQNDHHSLKSLTNLKHAINSLGYDCTYFGGIEELLSAQRTKEYDKSGIYLNFNDGLSTKSKRAQTPILLELLGVKYSGSSPLTHLAVSDKFFTNSFLMNRISNLNIPLSYLLKTKKDLINLDINFPIILKPNDEVNDEGSSIGITNNSICRNIEEALYQYDLIEHIGDIIAQEFIPGYELTNFFIRNKHNEILFNELLVIGKNGKTIMDDMVFTSTDKFEHRRQYYNPKDFFNQQDIEKIKNITANIANQLDILTIGRVDYKYCKGNLYFIEANTLPSFSMTSDIGEICRIYDLKYESIVEKLLESLN